MIKSIAHLDTAKYLLGSLYYDLNDISIFSLKSIKFHFQKYQLSINIEAKTEMLYKE